jgi:hypothetical protein
MERPWSQVCIIQGMILKEEEIPDLEKWLLEEVGCRIKFLETVVTKPDPGDRSGETGGRHDVFFSMHEDDVSKCAVKRLQFGVRWLEDVVKYNDSSYLYSRKILDKYQPTW